MADRLPSLLPRIAALVLVALAATAGMTYAAGTGVGSAPTVPTVTAGPPAPLVVPDVRNQAFVFAEGTLEDAGFAWRVSGSVHGYAANVVVSQSPAAGTRVVDSGSPLVTLTLRRNGSYPQTGAAADTSPYPAATAQPAGAAGEPIGPAAPATAAPATLKPATTTTAPATTQPAAVKSAKSVKSVKPAQASRWPQSRPVAFVVAGAHKEPLDEMPLPDRATALGTWLDTHKTMTPAAAKYWVYQNDWVVTGALFGWWHGADALKTLIAVDKRTQTLWGIGANSTALAQQALAKVQALSKS